MASTLLLGWVLVVMDQLLRACSMGFYLCNLEVLTFEMSLAFHCLLISLQVVNVGTNIIRNI